MKHQVDLFSLNDQAHHCATIAHDSYGSEPIIAGYFGKECTDEQRVFIKCGDRQLVLAAKTGNPILWSVGGLTYILFSKFEDIDEQGDRPRYPVERWKFCSMWFALIMVSKTQIILKNIREIEEGFGRLARSAPIQVEGVTLLPLYREKDPLCEIWEVDSDCIFIKRGQLEQIDPTLKPVYSPLGTGIAIQPTLYYADGVLEAYCRNMTVNYGTMWHATSLDKGCTWSPLKALSIFNRNSSPVITHPEKYIIWNDQIKRTSLLLSNLKTHRSIQLAITGNQLGGFSYPNYSWRDNELHIVHTNQMKIAHHVFDREYLDYMLNDPIETRNADRPTER